jgi:hypothetical protein
LPSYLINFLHIMKSSDPLSCLQQPTNGAYPVPNKTGPCIQAHARACTHTPHTHSLTHLFPFYLFTIRFNNIFQYTPEFFFYMDPALWVFKQKFCNCLLSVSLSPPSLSHAHHTTCFSWDKRHTPIRSANIVQVSLIMDRG